MKSVDIDGIKINFGEKHSWIRRLISSIWDVGIFYFKTLSPGYRALGLLALLTAIVHTTFRRDFSMAGSAGAFIAVFTFALPHLKYLVRSVLDGKIRILLDEGARKKLQNLQLSDCDQEHGFRYFPDHNGGEGIVLSSEINNKIFLDNTVDIQLNVAGNDKEAAIVSSLASRREIFSPHILGKFWRSLASKNPLINEEKIGFCNSFWREPYVCHVYKTTYFYSLCSGDLAMSKAVKDQGSKRPLIANNDQMTSLELVAENFKMRDFEDFRKPISLHGGVELIGISKDFWLRIAVQGDHTQFSQGKKAPLGSGSMDWADSKISRSLKHLIKISAAREFLEEWGKKHDTKKEIIIDKLLCLGFFRMPHRGGKPQFVVLCKFGNDVTDLRPDSAEVYVEDPEDDECLLRARDLGELNSAVSKILLNENKRNSVPLLGAMTCLQDAIRLRPDLVSRTLGYSHK